MTEPHASDERLTKAFQALQETDADVPDDVRERIWLAVSGALSAEERREVIELTATHPSHALAWRVAHEMWRAAEAGEHAPSATATHRRAMTWAPRWLAAAAVVVLGTTLGVWSLLNRPTSDQLRTSTGYRVESLMPTGTALPRDDLRLRWTPGPAGSRYRVSVTTQELEVLATAEELETNEWVVPAGALVRLGAGATVLWQVDATLPDGERITSETFPVDLR